MDAKFQVAWLKPLAAKNEVLERATRYSNDTSFVDISLDKLTEDELKHLREKLSKADKKDSRVAETLYRLNTFNRISADPLGVKVVSLKTLPLALRKTIGLGERKWLYTQTSDGAFVPWFVRGIEYHSGGRDQRAYVHISLVAFSQGKKQTSGISFHEADLFSAVKETDTEIPELNEELLVEDEGDEDSPKRVRRTPREGRKTAAELLTSEDYFLENKELNEQYFKELELYKAYSGLTGNQFLAKGSAISSRDTGSWWYRSNDIISMVREGLQTKVVMDNEAVDEEESSRDEKSPIVIDTFWKNGRMLALPIHPYVKVFDLDKHQFVQINVINLTPYEYKEGLYDKLILPEEQKDLVAILVQSSSEVLDDIISGKTGGTIVISTGPPGTGKTLTAEVVSEFMKRPLYQVQCSQLGTTEETLEKKLSEVLDRAARWKAILLIDEADVYVRTRGEDIQQNAIVGVFLRVLEYYRGIMFMTSNREVVIDDAIKSRATQPISDMISPTRPISLRSGWFSAISMISS